MGKRGTKTKAAKSVKVQFDTNALKGADTKTVERAIQGAVLTELAKLDLVGSLQIRQLPDRTRGIWIDIQRLA